MRILQWHWKVRYWHPYFSRGATANPNKYGSAPKFISYANLFCLYLKATRYASTTSSLCVSTNICQELAFICWHRLISQLFGFSWKKECNGLHRWLLRLKKRRQCRLIFNWLHQVCEWEWWDRFECDVVDNLGLGTIHRDLEVVRDPVMYYSLVPHFFFCQSYKYGWRPKQPINLFPGAANGPQRSVEKVTWIYRARSTSGLRSPRPHNHLKTAFESSNPNLVHSLYTHL